jgi:hypothetical protein
MRRTSWPVVLGVAVLTLLTLQSANAYGQHRRACRWWSRGAVTVWYWTGPSSPEVVRSPAGVTSFYSGPAEPSQYRGSIAVRPREVREPNLMHLSDVANNNFRGVFAAK